MPHTHIEHVARPRRAEQQQDSRWAGIGINAVAAASICRKGEDRPRQANEQPARRYAEDYATD